MNDYSFGCLLIALQCLSYAYLFVRWHRKDQEANADIT
jgi:hypothetical protein